MVERDYIGFDPVAWVDRLRDVNRGSQFDPVAKVIIEEELRCLKAKLAPPVSRAVAVSPE